MNKSIMNFAKSFSKIFIKPNFPDFNKYGKNLHLGCGQIYHPAFINIDGFPFEHVHYVQSIDNLSVFKTSSIDLIYASHCLEHFEYSKIENILVEWFRVLKTDGTLRLSVPDFDLLLKIYNDNDCDPEVIIPQLFGGQDNKYNYHYIIFNKKYLTKLLSKIGFKNIKPWIPGDSFLTNFNDFSSYEKNIGNKKYPVSLNIEASK